MLIDRGDLSLEVPVENVPYYQKAIVRQANRWNTPVYVATNLLESMVTNRKATIAEMNDIANTLLDGVHGLVLAAETAMGVDPVGAVDAVMRCIKSFEHTSMGSLLEEDRWDGLAGTAMPPSCDGADGPGDVEAAPAVLAVGAARHGVGGGEDPFDGLLLGQTLGEEQGHGPVTWGAAIEVPAR